MVIRFIDEKLPTPNKAQKFHSWLIGSIVNVIAQADIINCVLVSLL